MKYLDKSFTVGQPSTTAMACERCVYGRGEHAEWCPKFACVFPHQADYEEWKPSRTAKNQWRCRKCGRITQGAERRCLHPPGYDVSEVLDLLRYRINP